MTIKELKNELNNYDDNAKVFLDNHGSGEEMYEIIGTFAQEIYDDYDENIIEKNIVLYEY